MFPFSSFSDPKPYPPIQVERQNPRYASEILSNIGACSSEISAVSLYLYNNIILTETNKEFAEIFHKISVVEMHHLQIFGQLARMLGADPRLWTYGTNRPCYWSPACNRYPRQLDALLQNCLRGEQDTIVKYRRQSEQIQDAYVADMLHRIILDEELHAQVFAEMLAETKQRG